MRTLIFDTETTDKCNLKAPLEHQPYPVQIACVLKEGTQIYGVCNVIVNANEPIAPGAAATTHGITPHALEAYGITLAAATDFFLALVAQADRLVAHNIEFDLTIMMAAIMRIHGKEKALSLLSKQRVCTMLTAKPLCKLPGRYGNYKWPTLKEAYCLLVDENGFEGAHDALADVNACAAVLDALEERNARFVSGI